MAKAVLALYVLDPARYEDPVATLNSLLGLITPGRLRQVFVTPLPADGSRDFSFGAFTLGRTNAESIRAETSAVGSHDYFLRHGARLKQKWSIERSIDCTIIDHSQYGERLASVAIEKRYPIFEEYFRCLADYYLGDFWSAFDEAQELQVCFGAPYLSANLLRQLEGAQMIAIFKVRAHGRGWVAPSGTLKALAIRNSDPEIKATLLMLAAPPFKFKEFTDTEFDGFVRRAVDYVYRAQLDLLDAKYSDSLLKYVIALDLLFGEPGKSNDSVTRRSAVLLYQPLGISIREAKKRLADLYELRSLYVHAGSEITSERASEAKQYCVEVLAGLLKARRHKESKKPEFLQEVWLKLLDHIWYTADAGKEVPEADLIEAGILPLWSFKDSG